MKFKEYSSENSELVKSFIRKYDCEDFSIHHLEQMTSLLVFNEETSDLMLEWLPYTKSPLLRYQKRL